MKKITFTVPTDHKEAVKEAMWAVGAGKTHNYDCQAWEVQGLSQFRPLPGADPFIGNIGNHEKVEEFLIQIYCEDDYLEAAIEAMLASHPYQMPQFDVVTLENQMVVKDRHPKCD